EVRTVRKPLANLLRPLRLARPQAVRTVPAAAGACIPFRVWANAAFRLVVSNAAFTAVRHHIDRRILLLAQSSGPQIAPLPQNLIDRRLDRCLCEHISFHYATSNHTLSPALLLKR